MSRPASAIHLEPFASSHCMVCRLLNGMGCAGLHGVDCVEWYIFISVSGMLSLG